MKDRIKKIRKELDLTQQKFADRIGVKQNTIAQYEIGRNIPVDTVISLICKEFNVNEEWLRTGKGEMFKPVPSDVLEALTKEYNLSPIQYEFIKKFVTMKQDTFNDLMDFFNSILKDSSFSATLQDTTPQESDIEERVNAYREYLEAKEKATEKLSS